MTYFTDLHTYLHQSSLLIQAYPDARVTTKYSLPRKSKSPKQHSTTSDAQAQSTDPSSTRPPKREPREPAATLSLKTFHPGSGICLQYRTDKAAEVGRLMGGLGRLAKGEVIEMPSANLNMGAEADRMDVDAGGNANAPMVPEEAKTASQMTQQQGAGGGGSGGKKKKKGKK